MDNQIRNIRRQIGMTLERLAAITGVSTGYLSQAERGIIENIPAHRLSDLAKALGTTVEDLTRPDEDKEQTAVDMIRAILKMPRAANEVIVLGGEDIERMKALVSKD